MKKLLMIALSACSLTAAAAEPLPMPARVAAGVAPEMSDVAQHLSRLNDFIGSYPPRISGEQQRQQVYEDWSIVMRKAWQLEDTQPRAEGTLYALADAYRQGHNLDVQGAAHKAMESLDLCLSAYPDSTACHWTASYFYLSIHPSHAPKGEASLLRLRQLLKNQPDKEVERGMVFAYLFQQKMDAALKQVDYYLTLVPGDEHMRNVRQAIADKKIQVKHSN